MLNYSRLYLHALVVRGPVQKARNRPALGLPQQHHCFVSVQMRWEVKMPDARLHVVACSHEWRRHLDSSGIDGTDKREKAREEIIRKPYSVNFFQLLRTNTSKTRRIKTVRLQLLFLCGHTSPITSLVSQSLQNPLKWLLVTESSFIFGGRLKQKYARRWNTRYWRVRRKASYSLSSAFSHLGVRGAVSHGRKSRRVTRLQDGQPKRTPCRVKRKIDVVAREVNVQIKVRTPHCIQGHDNKNKART